MGFNTALIILNDQLHDLARDPRAGELIQDIVREAAEREWPRAGIDAPRRLARYGRYGVGALQSEHADTTHIVAIGRNEIVPLGFSGSLEPEAILRSLADQLGFEVRPKRKPPSGGPAPRGQDRDDAAQAPWIE